MKTRINGFVLVRWFLAAIFIVSGVEKLLSPIENFIYTIQSYELWLHPGIIRIIALVFPWIELFVGIFLALGLWTRAALVVSGAMGTGFLVFVGQAMIRSLPLTHCGCFGDLVQWPLWTTLVLDLTILSLSAWLYFKIDRTHQFSLDQKLL